MVGDGPHLHIIADDDPVKAQFTPQQTADRRARQGRREVGVDRAIEDVGGHYRIASARSNQLGVGLEFDAGPGMGHIDEVHVRVVGCRTVPWKVLERAGHTTGAVALDKSPRVAHDLGRIGREAAPDAADDRAVVVEVEIDDRRQIEVKAQVQQSPRSLPSGAARFLGIARAQRLRRRQLG